MTTLSSPVLESESESGVGVSSLDGCVLCLCSNASTYPYEAAVCQNSSRNKNNISSIFFLDLLLHGDSYRVLRVETQPVLKPGRSGLFDDCGVTPSCVTRIKDSYYLYYTGWNKQVTIPFQTFCGVAKLSDDLESAEKLYLTPILDRCNEEPFSVGACFVSFCNILLF